MNSNAAARKRRAPPQVNELPPPPLQTRQFSAPGSAANAAAGSVGGAALTLPQVINVIDKRIIALENFVKTAGEGSAFAVGTAGAGAGAGGAVGTSAGALENSALLQSVIQEFSARFDILAEEIGNLKDTVLKLQTYTMDVNKMLVDERIKVLSDFDNQIGLNLSIKENIKLEELSVSTVELTDEINVNA